MPSFAQRNPEGRALDNKFQAQLGKSPKQAFQMAKDLLVEANRESSWIKKSVAHYYLAAYYTRQNDFENGLANARACLSAAEIIGDSSQLVNGYNILGSAYEAMGLADSALVSYQMSLKLARAIGRKGAIVRSMLNMGIIYCSLGQFPESLEKLYESLEQSKKYNNRPYFPITYLTIGEVYLQMHDLQKAADNFYLGLFWAKRVRSEKYATLAMFNLGTLNFEKGDTTEALCWYEQALEKSIAENLPGFEAKASAQLALLYSGIHETKAAESAANRAIEIGIRDKDFISMGLAYRVKGQIDLKAGNSKSAYRNCLEAYKIVLKTKEATVMEEVCECLWISAEAEGNYKAAFTYYRVYKEWQDSLVGIGNALAIARIEAQLDYDRKSLEDSVAQATLDAKREVAFEIERSRAANRTQIFIWLGAFLSLLILALGAGLILFRKQNNTLSIQNKRIQEQNEAINHSLEEKEILLSEVHHRVKNNLQVMSSLLEMQAMAALNPSAKEILEESQMRVQAMAMIHQRLYQEERFASMDFGAYISELAYSIKGIYDDTDLVSIEIDAQGKVLSAEASVVLGLIANELISNAFKHAFNEKGRKGILRIRYSDSETKNVALDIEDNGLHFQENIQNLGADRLGLKLVNGLCRQMKGSLEITQSKLGGAKFAVQIQDRK